jgi:hypothetical protein
MLAALVLVASLSAPAETAPAPVDARPAVHAGVHAVGARPGYRHAAADTPPPDPNAPGHKMTFVEQYLSYQLPAQAMPAVRQGEVMSYVLGYLLYGICGSLWGPVVAVEGASFDGDIATNWFLSTLLWSVIATAATATLVGGALWLAVPYLSTVATMNAIDRQLKKKGGGTAAPPGTPGQPGQEPPPATEQPPPSYAY